MEGRYGEKIYNYKYELQKEQRLEVHSPSLAEVYLKRLAERKKRRRITGGAVGVIGGGICLGLGASLAIPSGAERELKDVLRISDLAHRERASHEALSYLAARGKKSRIISCIVLAGFSAYSLFRKDSDYIMPGFFGALAVSSLIRKTPEERAFQNYQKEREQQKKLGFHLGFGPHGGAFVCLSLSY